MDMDTLKREALEGGFTLAAPIDIGTIQCKEEVREMCAVNKCHAYNTNWSCPPGCGSVDECQARVNGYRAGLLVETTAELEDEFDFETMGESAKTHGDNFIKFLKKLHSEHPELEVLPLGTGVCQTCETCTYPDAPCRFPELLSFPMEGYGMVISDVCKANGVVYYHGRNTLTYVGCYLLREKTP